VYFLYSLLLGLALTAVIPLYFVKLRLGKGESLHLAARLGFRLPARTRTGPFVWIHAVSVGEVLSLQSLVRELKVRHPDWEIGFSSLTNAGFRMAEARIKDADHLFFVPFDLGWSVRRTFRRLRPDLLVLAESEFWPRLLREAGKSGCPVLAINGRISTRSFRRYIRLRRLARPLLGRVSSFLVQTETDRTRLEAVGVPPDRISVAGNLKCETRLPEFGEGEVGELKRQLGIPAGKKVLVAGSIHRGEAGSLLEAFAAARRVRDDILLVLAPRHPEKFPDVEKDPVGRTFIVRRRTNLAAGEPWDILILDTIGELARFYALSDAAFIGGSLIAWGGQNLLEPAFYGKPVFFGPHMENFADLAARFVRDGGAAIVETPGELTAMFRFEDAELLSRRGASAKAILESLQGATARTLAAIESFVPHGRR
jgi:3-deoxy-D-manno-octulosonic-acid transferase